MMILPYLYFVILKYFGRTWLSKSRFLCTMNDISSVPHDTISVKLCVSASSNIVCNFDGNSGSSITSAGDEIGLDTAALSISS